MKRFALLRLESGANKVIFDTKAETLFDAVRIFRNSIKGVSLDDDGYGKLGDVSYCVAEYFQPFYTV